MRHLHLSLKLILPVCALAMGLVVLMLAEVHLSSAQRERTALRVPRPCLQSVCPASPSPPNPPDRRGYFSLLPVASWTSLPSGEACRSLVHASPWEIRPENNDENRATQDPEAIHASFLARPRSGLGTYDPKWDTWLLPRVDGQFAGTTDEIFQWAACKWGLPDNLIRAVAVRESKWYQHLTYRSGRCVPKLGCGDWFSGATDATEVYCNGLAKVRYDYQRDYGSGLCPKTFSIIGEMSWWDPAWGLKWPANQNGTFPFNRNSTAFAVDYYASQIRGCFEGWQWELGSSYRAGDLWGCVGAWYSGRWRDPGALAYISRVQGELDDRTWLTHAFAERQYGCDRDWGCPG